MMTTASVLSCSILSLVCAKMAEESNLGLEEYATDSTWVICVSDHSPRLFMATRLFCASLILCLSATLCHTIMGSSL
jgi:hypothetical protein